MNMPQQSIKITIPCSTANLGPGFDCLGAALSPLSLTVHVSFDQTSELTVRTLTYNTSNPSSSPVSLDFDSNLITVTATKVANAFGRDLPKVLKVGIDNDIPLGRGLGSSGAAVVAGVLLANHCASLALPDDCLLDLCVALEGHPDNVAASFLGGMVTSSVSDTFLLQLDHIATTFRSAHQSDQRYNPLTTYIKIPVHSRIKAVVCVPDFQLSTEKARSVLPASFAKAAVVSNLQRLSLLISAFFVSAHSSTELTEIPYHLAVAINVGLQDVVHQPYRQSLVPGLKAILEMKPSEIPGLLGACLSGAGPTILCLATSNFTLIGDRMRQCVAQHTMSSGESTSQPIECQILVLEISGSGALLTAL